MAKTAPAAPKTCACGNPIYPYVIGTHSYQASFCPTCIEQQEKDEAEAKKASNIVTLGLQRRFLESSFDNLHDPKPSEAALCACRNYAEEIAGQKQPSGKGLYLWGPNGTGKTHLSVAVARTTGHYLFVNTLLLIDALKRSFSTEEECEVYESARWAPLLVLDDLGKERHSEWTEERFFSLIASRWDEMLSTIVTSNYSPSELPKIVGAASASRILGSSLTVKIDGPDHRRFGMAAI